MNNVQEAISTRLEILADAGATWAYIDIDVSPFLEKTEKATVTLPKLVIRRIDELVAAGKAKNRSAFLADSTLKPLR